MVGGQQDGRQHVVEVVRDATGQRADRVHLLGLRHLGFERLLLGDLDGVDDGASSGACSLWSMTAFT